MQNSRQHPQLSAHTHLYGIYNFNKILIVPPGTKAVIFEDPETRSWWVPHGKKHSVLGQQCNILEAFPFMKQKPEGHEYHH